MRDQKFRPILLDSSQSRELLASFPEPSHISIAKALDHLDGHLQQFLRLSSFCCVATSDRAGNHDVSPRGDPPGSFKVLDRNTVCIADRPGDHRIDSLRHIAENPHVGMLFFVPGWSETVRLNGLAQLSVDDELLSMLAVQDRLPRLAIVVSVQVAYLHCSKAFKRAQFWEPSAFAQPGALPSFSRIVSDQVRLSSEQQARLDAYDAMSSREGLWEPVTPA